jgi:Protein of unknown function (DUF3618)
VTAIDPTPQAPAAPVAEAAAAPDAAQAVIEVPKAPSRSYAEIQADLEAQRARLSSTVDQIAERVRPEAIAQRGMDKARGAFVHPDGSLRIDRVAMVVGFVALFITYRVRWRKSCDC